jgi:hypothetical protein
MSEDFSLIHKIGAIIYDLPRYLWAMRPSWGHNNRGLPWVFMRNRNERLITEEGGKGVLCDWRWTSKLHIARVFPTLGLQLMKRTFRDWRIALQPEPSQQTKNVDVSFIIGHKGLSRLSHLLFTLKTIAAQKNVSIECLIVEQAVAPEIQQFLPSWVRYMHTPLPYPEMPYCRSWAFNVGARIARGSLLVFHDNDMLVPREYALQLLGRYMEGYEVINLKRFIFYLCEAHSARIFSSGEVLLDKAPKAVVQNLEAGGSVAISKDTFFAIGGFDESFMGWGGEDNEFWERAQTRRVWPYGYLPIIHLWHTSQSEKLLGENASTKKMYWEYSRISPETRIKNLVDRSFGSFEGPSSG